MEFQINYEAFFALFGVFFIFFSFIFGISRAVDLLFERFR